MGTCSLIAATAFGLPPPRNRADREFGGIVRNSDVHVALIPLGVVDTKRYRPALGRAREVMLVDFFRLPTPRSPLVPEIAYQLLLLCIDAYDGQTGCDKLLLLGRDVLELFVSVGAPRHALLPSVCLQRETHLFEQASNRTTARLMSFVCESPAQPA
jgi:hypothetical protein